MVSLAAPDRRERAQLLLAGSIIIALLLVGITVILNSIVFTENVAGGNSIEVTGDIDEFNAEASRNARGIALRVNHRHTNHTHSNVAIDVKENISKYSRILAESYADTGSVFVDLSYTGTEVNGTRILQYRDRDLTQSGGSADWTVFDDPTKMGWFLLNLNVTQTSDASPARVVIQNDSTTATYTVKRDVGNRILVNSTLGASPATNTTCVGTGGRVLLNILDGSSPTSGCAFNATQSLDGPFTSLRIENGDNANGKYGIVVNRTTSSISGIPMACHAAASPCGSEVAWEIAIQTTYQSNSIAYRNRQNVTVYHSP